MQEWILLCTAFILEGNTDLLKCFQFDFILQRSIRWNVEFVAASSSKAIPEIDAHTSINEHQQTLSAGVGNVRLLWFDGEERLFPLLHSLQGFLHAWRQTQTPSISQLKLQLTLIENTLLVTPLQPH